MAGRTMHGRPAMTRATATGFTRSYSRAGILGKCIVFLKENGISYVAFDNAVRQAQFIKRPNRTALCHLFSESVRRTKYNGMVIYKVPDSPPPKLRSLPEGVINMFDGGRGTGKGEFDSPTAMTVDANGNILVADTGNGRIEKFSPTGISRHRN